MRVDDRPEHRRWLRQTAQDLVSLQDLCSAIREVIGNGGPGIPSNASYGTGETSMIQSDGDPVSDMLYSCNFALIGLHEAAAATGDAFYSSAEDRLADLVCRIQIRSESHPDLLQKVKLKNAFNRLRPHMLPDSYLEAAKPTPTTRLPERNP